MPFECSADRMDPQIEHTQLTNERRDTGPSTPQALYVFAALTIGILVASSASSASAFNVTISLGPPTSQFQLLAQDHDPTSTQAGSTAASSTSSPSPLRFLTS